MDNEDDLHAMQLCTDIASETIESTVSYIDEYNCVSHVGHFVATTLVECIYHLSPSLAVNVPSFRKSKAISSIRESQQLLQRVSVYRGTGKRAQKMVELVFDGVVRMETDEQFPCIAVDHKRDRLGEDICETVDVDAEMTLGPEYLDVCHDWLIDAFFSDTTALMRYTGAG